MGIERHLNLIMKQMKEVHPNLLGHHGQDYMREYLKTAIMLYEKNKHEEKMQKAKYPYIPLSWYHD